MTTTGNVLTAALEQLCETLSYECSQLHALAADLATQAQALERCPERTRLQLRRTNALCSAEAKANCIARIQSILDHWKVPPQAYQAPAALAPEPTTTINPIEEPKPDGEPTV